MEKIIQYLEENAGVESAEFIAESENDYLFAGYIEGEEEEIEIHVTFTNRVYFNDEEQDLYLPFNVWSIRKEMEI